MQMQLNEKFLVLVIDDNPKNLQVVSQIIDSAGYMVAAATDEAQVLSMIASKPPDLILLDIVMPGVNGFDLCRKLKALPEAADIPIIMLSVKDSAEDIVQGFEAGAADYVSKPFNAEELMARVNAQIELKQVSDQQTRLIDELEKALSDVKQLAELIPICAHCKKVRADQEYWQQVEDYIATHSTARILHSICPDCLSRGEGQGGPI